MIDLIHEKVIVHTNQLNSRYQKIEEYTFSTIKPIAFPSIEVEISQLLFYLLTSSHQ